MTKVILGMTMSLDGFINDSSGSVEALYPDLVPGGRPSRGENPFKIPER
jgi:hypothetical protein